MDDLDKGSNQHATNVSLGESKGLLLFKFIDKTKRFSHTRFEAREIKIKLSTDKLIYIRDR